jgi:hypothetical protein
MGRDYVLLQLRLGQQGPFDFVVDTGLTAELITPHLRDVLGLPPPARLLRQSVGAGGAVPLPLVELAGGCFVLWAWGGGGRGGQACLLASLGFPSAQHPLPSPEQAPQSCAGS